MSAAGLWPRIAASFFNRFGRRKWFVMTAFGQGRVEIPGYKSRSGATRYVARNMHHLVIIHIDPEHAFIFCKVAVN